MLVVAVCKVVRANEAEGVRGAEDSRADTVSVMNGLGVAERCSAVRTLTMLPPEAAVSSR